MTVEYKPEFKPFGKIPRLNREVVITEKIDGTNGIICVDQENNKVYAGSRNRWLAAGSDNFGFHNWVMQNADILRELLGHGYHYGEWWGQGIQRRYGMDKKVFSLFNTHRWGFLNDEAYKGTHKDIKGNNLLSCVPVLYQGDFDTAKIEEVRSKLKEDGSSASPGFMDPEGVMVYHTAARFMMKYPFKDAPKGKQTE